MLKKYMQKYITAKIKETIEGKKNEWAQNYVAREFQATLTTPEAKKQVESAEHNMRTIESTLGFLETFLKNESKKK